ncbi:dihydrodipicolinate synthase family protein [Dyadobacter sp. 676]|uniref:Dihydrodipicolinate synthase family protein n=1 Tax=Dyadobacter sp. 676 TaxID=3088362 RepID=A0AAU8FH15_9BACT
MNTIQHTDGLIAALFTPFHSDGSVHYELLPPLAEHLISSRISGIFICGSNGEGPNLTLEERMRIAETVIDAGKGRLRNIVHVGHASIAEARKLARHAQEAGADAISSVAAFYFKPTSVQNLADCMTDIAAGAPQLPFYYYHIPSLTGFSVDVLDLMGIAKKQIPNFAGIKYTAATLWEYQECLNFDQGRYDVLYGFDENHLPALAMGAKGAIGSTFNFAAPFYLKVREYFEAGDMERARRQMLFCVEMVRIVVQYPPIPAQKAVMKMLGFDMGPCRLPLTALPDDQYEALRRQLAGIGFFDQLNAERSITE